MEGWLWTGYSAPEVGRWGLEDASWLVGTPDQVLALGESAAGRVSWSRVSATGIEVLGATDTGGSHPCHAVLAGDVLFVAHYGDGAVSALPRRGEGWGPATLAVPPTAGAHAHCLAVAPGDDTLLLLVDLGREVVETYRREGTTLRRLAALPTGAGSGPRHVALHPTLPLAYVVTELGNELLTVACAADRLELVDRRPTVPPGGATSYASGVRVAPDGRFVLMANRGQDSVASWPLKAGLPGERTLTPSGGRWPRDLLLSRDGRLLAVANQHTDRVALFRRDPTTGALTLDGGFDASRPSGLLLR